MSLNINLSLCSIDGENVSPSIPWKNYIFHYKSCYRLYWQLISAAKLVIFPDNKNGILCEKQARFSPRNQNKSHKRSNFFFFNCSNIFFICSYIVNLIGGTSHTSRETLQEFFLETNSWHNARNNAI